MIIAVDGPAASGKGTLARRLAQHFNLGHLDTGKLYRATALRALASGGDPADPAVAEAAAKAVRAADLGDPRLADEAVARGASVVAAIPSVRQALFAFQRDFARHPPGGAAGAVLDGRDIGTFISPEADVKIFVTATPETRATRRALELKGQGDKIDYAAVLDDIVKRDERDTKRSFAPLRPAEDAVILDTTKLDIDAAFKAALAIVEQKKRVTP